jgi:spoIIIJ-associated protein
MDDAEKVLDGDAVMKPGRARAPDEGSRARTFLSGLLEHMKISATVDLAEEDERITLRIDCANPDDVQRVIGRRGQVIDALQHVVSKALVKLRGEKGRIVVVDTGGYRQRHIDQLEELARRMAEKCVASGKPVELTPMPAHDRRIVHMAIAAVGGVSTRSEGEGDLRHIVVLPA